MRMVITGLGARISAAGGRVARLLFAPDEPIVRLDGPRGEEAWLLDEQRESGTTIPAWRRRADAEIDAEIEAGRMRNEPSKKLHWEPRRPPNIEPKR